MDYVALITITRSLSRAEQDRLADVLSGLASDMRKGATHLAHAGTIYPIGIVPDNRGMNMGGPGEYGGE